MPKKNNCVNLHVKRREYEVEAERKENVIGNRIAEGRKKSEMTLDTFKNLLAQYGVDVSKSAISKWEQGITVPNAYQFMAISYALGIDNIIEYFTGNYMPELNAVGIKKVSEYKADLIASGKYTPERTFSNFEYIEMPVSCLAASAGTGEFLDDGNYEMVSFPACSVPKGADFGIRVNGDSMEPVYHDGQIVWVKECEDIQIGEVGIFVYDSEGYIKVYSEQEPADKETFTDIFGVVHKQPVMISYNKSYEPKIISPDIEFRIVGKVLSM